MSNSDFEELDSVLKAELMDAASKATWRRNYSGGPQGIMGAVKDAIHRKAAEKIALLYGLRHGKVPEGKHSITISVGPANSGADYTNSYISDRYDISVEINFEFPVNKEKTLPSNEDLNDVIDLGPIAIDLRPGYSYQSHLWIKKIENEEWEIIMLAEPSRRKKDPEIKVIGRFSTIEAIEYLDELGIAFNPDDYD